MLRIVVLLTIFVTLTAQAHESLPSKPIPGVAIVIVDMQDKFFDEPAASLEYSLAQSILVDVQLKLLDWAKEHDVPVLIFEYQEYGNTMDVLRTAISQLKTGRYYYMEKTKDGGFAERRARYHSPRAILNHWGVKDLIITGINGPFCVKKTAIGALLRGYNVMSSPDLVGNFNRSEPTYPDCGWSERIHPLPEWLQFLTGRMTNFSDHEELLSCERLLAPAA